MELFILREAFTYKKEERLKGHTITQKVFREGLSFSSFPLRIFYLQEIGSGGQPLKTGVGVPGKNFKKATDRNFIKRLLREVYRTQNIRLEEYLSVNKRQAAVFILYTGKELPEYNNLKQLMGKALQKLIHKLDEKDPSNT